MEKDFVVYFEFYGKKMKTTVLAENEHDAKNKVKEKIKFHKVEKANSDFNKCMDTIDELNDFIKKM